MPDALYRKTKAVAALQTRAVAALRGSSMKDLIVRAVEHDVNGAPEAKKPGRRPTKSPKHTINPVTKFPLIQWKGPKMDLSNFDFDDLLG